MGFAATLAGVADLGPAILTIVGTSIGGMIAASAGIAQARMQARIETRRLDHELRRTDDERRAAAESDRLGVERAVLLRLVDEAARIAGTAATNQAVVHVRALTYQVDDAVLRGMASQDMWYREPEFLQRIGYLLRTPNVDDRTATGHLDAHATNE